MRSGSPRNLAFMLAAMALTGAAFLSHFSRQIRAAEAAQAVEQKPKIEQISESGITHSYFAAGSDTYIAKGDGTIVWHYGFDTRDGWVLPDGHVLMAVTRGGKYPHGAIVEVDREHDNNVLFEYPGTQEEVNSVQLTDGGKSILLTEAGDKPRLLEVDRSGKILVEFPLKCQTGNKHLQTRMARKLKNGNYLVPHLLDFVVREYKPDGTVAWEAKTPNWPFTAIRLENGHTVINCTHGNEVVEVDAEGKIVWHLTNKDLGTEIIKDACGGQRLPNGNTVITSYASGAGEIRMFEVTPEKKIVWTLKSDQAHGVHEFQILDTNGKALEGEPHK